MSPKNNRAFLVVGLMHRLPGGRPQTFEWGGGRNEKTEEEWGRRRSVVNPGHCRDSTRWRI